MVQRSILVRLHMASDRECMCMHNNNSNNNNNNNNSNNDSIFKTNKVEIILY